MFAVIPEMFLYFVFATVGNPLMYIVAWLVGSAVTCFMLGALKKNIADM